MELTKVYGAPCYPEGYEISVNEEIDGNIIPVHLKAVKQIKDGDSCFGCYLETDCRSREYLSPIGKFCMTTIFQKCE